METRGGKRAGAGRPTLYPGKTERVTVKLTPLAKDAAEATAEELEASTAAVETVTFSDAVEYLIRKASGL